MYNTRSRRTTTNPINIAATIVFQNVPVAFKSRRLKVGYLTVLTIIAERNRRITGNAKRHFGGASNSIISHVRDVTSPAAAGIGKPRNSFPPPVPADAMIGVQVSPSIGDYRSGDEIWCRRIGPDEFASALNRDILLPRHAGRFVFGRLIGREGDKLQILPLGSGSRQQVISDPPWGAVAVQLVRQL